MTHSAPTRRPPALHRQRDEFHRGNEDIQPPPADPPVERPWQFERRNRKPWRQRMIAIVETATGTVEAIVESLDGVDMAGRHSIALPEGYDPIAVSTEIGRASCTERVCQYV